MIFYIKGHLEQRDRQQINLIIILVTFHNNDIVFIKINK